MRNRLSASLLLIFTSLTMSATATANASECGKVTIADMSWTSASFMANLDSFIIAHGFGCDTELAPGDTMATGASMIEKGKPDIAPEFWPNTMQDALDKGVADGRIRYSGMTLSDGGEEGFWVPAYMVEKDPSLATIAGIKANAKLFKHPEDPDKSAFMTCPAGWNCEISAGQLFNALKLEEAGFEVLDPGSGAAQAASIAKAYERKEAWFGYYWTPTPALGKYKMVKVSFGEGVGVDKKHFDECISQADCLDPKPTMYGVAIAASIATEAFAQRQPDVMAYLAKRALTNMQMSEVLAWIDDEQADGEYATEHFLKNYESIWLSWVDAATAKKIKKALAEL